MNPEVCKPTPFLVNPPVIFFFRNIKKLHSSLKCQRLECTDEAWKLQIGRIKNVTWGRLQVMAV